MRASPFLTAMLLNAGIAVNLQGCDNKDQKMDQCLDKAVAACTPVGARECGLSKSATDAEFDKCPAYAACEAASVSNCMFK